MYLGVIRSRPTTYSKVTIQHNPFQAHSLQQSYHPTQSVPHPQPRAKLPSNTLRSRPTAYSKVTIQHTPFQAHSLQQSYHPTHSVPDPQPTAKLPSNTLRSRPTVYSKVTIQHNHLHRKNIIQNKKCKNINNIKFIYLTFIHCTNKQITELN
jgi:hypothetical protein